MLNRSIKFIHIYDHRLIYLRYFKLRLVFRILIYGKGFPARKYEFGELNSQFLRALLELL
jgi:hypothetical protein